MTRTLALRLNRRPLQILNTDDDGAVRDFLARQLQEQLVLYGHAPPRVVLLAARFWEEASLEDLTEDPTVLAALLPSLRRDRADVARCCRIGLVRDEEGLQATILELTDGVSLTWTLHRCSVVENAGGRPTLAADWSRQQGQGLATLPTAVQPWLDSGAHKAVSRPPTTTPPDLEALDLRMAHLQTEAPLPTEPESLLARLAEPLELETLRQDSGAYVFLIGRPTGQLERWELRGDAGLSLDEVIRVSAQSEPADFVVLMHPAEVDTGEGKLPALVSILELGGSVTRRIRAYRPVEDGMEVYDAVYQDAGPSGAASWLEVAPMVGLSLFVKGVPGQRGPSAEA